MVLTTDNPTSSISTFQHQVRFDGTNDYIEVPYKLSYTTVVTDVGRFGD